MTVHVPTKRGRLAFDELDRAPWEKLAHAYGRGVVEEKRGFGVMRWEVARSLRELDDDDEETREDAMNSLFGMICHQGTIYEASAHAVPFLAAFAAGDDVERERAKHAIFLAVQIGASSTYVAPDLGHAGAASADVAKETRDAFVSARNHFDAIAARMPASEALVAALLSLREEPNGWTRLEALVTAFARA